MQVFIHLILKMPTSNIIHRVTNITEADAWHILYNTCSYSTWYNRNINP